MAPTAFLNGPLIVCRGAEIRHCAFVRGSALVGEGAVVGNSTELKNVILFDKVQVPHYNYVGDSILGYKSHMGAGSITSNVKSDKLLVKIHGEDGEIETGRKKVGAMLGDQVEVGCGSVLNPGTVIGRESNIYPLSSVRGCVSEKSIYKRLGEVAEKRKSGKNRPSRPELPISFRKSGRLHRPDQGRCRRFHLSSDLHVPHKSGCLGGLREAFSVPPERR